MRPSNYTREKMGELVAVGGLVVPSKSLKEIENELRELCDDTRFSVPLDENLKWSPAKRSWLRTHLSGRLRQELFGEMLDCAARHGCSAMVAISDARCKKANKLASDHEVDATLLALERFDTWLGDGVGVVFVSRPAGGTTDAEKFVAECIEHRLTGTKFVEFKSLALNPIVVPAWQSRLLQMADLITSITNAKVAGGNSYADALFPKISEMMPETTRGVKGGAGLKIHPSFRYRNLYHWVLGDDCYVEGANGIGLPEKDKPYPNDEMTWR